MILILLVGAIILAVRASTTSTSQPPQHNMTAAHRGAYVYSLYIQSLVLANRGVHVMNVTDSGGLELVRDVRDGLVNFIMIMGELYRVAYRSDESLYMYSSVDAAAPATGVVYHAIGWKIDR